MDKISERLKFEVLLGIKLTKLESDILAYVKREQEPASYRPQVKRDVYDILQSLSDGLRMV